MMQTHRALVDGDPSGTGQFYVDENGNVVAYGSSSAKSVPGITAPQVVTAAATGAGGKGRSGGGGGGGADRGDFEGFMKTLLSQGETIDAWREEQLEQLREYRDAKLATEQEYNEAERRILADHEAAKAELERRAQEARMSAFSGALGDLASLMASENEKLFKVGKAAALAEAIVSGYSAAVSAWDKGMKVGGPPVAAAFTSASLAKTGALISSISSASSRGGSAGAAAAGGVSGVSSQPLEVRVQGLDPNALFTGASVSALFEQLQDEAGTRGLELSFAQ
jgi:hypothetical protein